MVVALSQADDDVTRLQEHLTDSKRSAKTTQEYTEALVRLHRKLESTEPVWRVDRWARVSAVLPILKKLRHTTAKTQVAMLLVALRRWPAGAPGMDARLARAVRAGRKESQEGRQVGPRGRQLGHYGPRSTPRFTAWTPSCGAWGGLSASSSGGPC